MKKIGLIGGLGPESTLDYYRGIISAFAAAGANYDYPEIFIHSLNLGSALRLFQSGQWDQVAELLLESVMALHRAGAQFAAIASNTPHLAFEQVQARSPLPLISIVEATRDRASAMGLKRPGLLGTRVTMGSTLYQDCFAPRDMEVVAPPQEDQALIQQRLDTEIELGVFKDSTRRELLGIAARLKDERAIDSVILGCTELPLILDRDELGLPFLNTAAIHVAAIVDYCRR
ncbi:MAG: amino acid racemase [Proteobacteria bacterium]|nr:amino acid racemase [Pseudomonadota bacterium]MBU2517730.1 amino acid racemase [Pseudomonadota bacterium]